MSEAAIIPEGHQRMVWVFAVDMPAEALDAMEPAELADALGLWTAPDPAHVERFDAATIAEYGLAKYVSDANGMDVPADEAQRLDALEGSLCLIYSKALATSDTKFAPEPPFTLIGRYGTAPEVHSMQRLKSAGAEGMLPQGKPPKSDARIGGMVATVVLIFLAIFVAAFVWVAG